MGANKKTVLKGFDYMHCDDFAKYLSDMAAKGWHFKEWGVGLKFEKGEPENATYTVEVFTKASENDMRPEPKTEEFAEYCEAAGWKFIDARQKFCIFKRSNEDAVALYTPAERVENAFRGAVSGSSITLLVLYGINALLQWMNVTNFFADYIFTSSFLYTFAVWNVLFLGQLCMFGYAFYEKYRLMKLVKAGETVYIGVNQKDGKFHVHMRDIYIALLCLLVLAYTGMAGNPKLVWTNASIIVVTLGFCIVLSKLRPSRDANVLIQLVFCFGLVGMIIITSFAFSQDDKAVTTKQNEVPLFLWDYREGTEEITDISIYEKSNILGNSATYFVFSKGASIHYDIYQSKHAWILDHIWNDELEKKKNVNISDCTELWDAHTAFRNPIGDYYVRYENQIFILSEDENLILTKEQIAIIREKMNLR